MNWFLGLVIAALMVLTLVTLIRGIVAFLATTKAELERPEGSGPSETQLLQNKMMFRRIFYQAAAILVVAVLLFANQK
ncbi:MULTISPECIES: HIG1 domain-containing protein [unclassified Novosphingobium]|jgi:Hypoxia induced protein conserved region|uniref:HIG1 domain-containing protein n=1 Tax=unclassified Novosphingobium TaxID=2644732 RepID=UPI0025F6CF3A|nr:MULTISPECIES: HIG1 domain-containing protein [unclassified Novosphingobium]HQV03272.1 HIG1 domain-containing protein [Novosphingobium sp.]